jgi:hypothetical protein
VEFTRRLTVPYYEEAQLYWNQAEQDGLFDGANEISLSNTGANCPRLRRIYLKTAFAKLI